MSRASSRRSVVPSVMVVWTRMHPRVPATPAPADDRDPGLFARALAGLHRGRVIGRPILDSQAKGPDVRETRDLGRLELRLTVRSGVVPELGGDVDVRVIRLLALEQLLPEHDAGSADGRRVGDRRALQ